MKFWLPELSDQMLVVPWHCYLLRLAACCNPVKWMLRILSGLAAMLGGFCSNSLHLCQGFNLLATEWAGRHEESQRGMDGRRGEGGPEGRVTGLFTGSAIDGGT